MKPLRHRFRVISAVLLVCLLSAQWAAAAHAVFHAAAPSSARGDGQRDSDAHHAGAACLQCLAFHSVDHSAPAPFGSPVAVGHFASYERVQVCVPATPAAPATNIRAPPEAS